jgi:hypothetical protein
MGFRRLRRLLVVTSALVLLCGNIALARSESGSPEITVLVQNSTRLSAEIANESELEAARIFRSAGIAITWVNCFAASRKLEDACQGTPGPGQFVLHIVPTGKTSSDLVFGLAFLDERGVGKYSDVFLDRIEEACRQSGADLSRLLGAVAAHELGHLLLGSHGHSYSGVMTAVWKERTLSYESMGFLLFTHEQGSMMRARIENPANAGLREASARKVGARFGPEP